MRHVGMRSLLALLFPIFTGGCGLLVNGTRDSVFIDSQPPGARVRVDGEPVARTPAKIAISRGSPPRRTVEKEDSRTEEACFPRLLDAGWILFDLLLTLGIRDSARSGDRRQGELLPGSGHDSVADGPLGPPPFPVSRPAVFLA